MQILKIFACAACSVMLWGQVPLVAQTQQEIDLNTASRVSISGTSVTLMLPNVFQYDETQAAYIYPGASASISIQFLPGKSLEQIIAGIDRSDPVGQGMLVLSSEELKTDAGLRAKLMTCSVSASSSAGDQSVEFFRLVFVAGTADHTVYITANYPKITEKVLAEPIRAALLSVEF